MRALAVVLVASGCHVTPPKPTTPTVDLFLVDRQPHTTVPLVAYRDGDGPWRPVDLTLGAARVVVRSETYDLASVCPDEDWPGVEVVLLPRDAIGAGSIEACFPNPPNIPVDGRVTGIDAGHVAWAWTGYTSARVAADGSYRGTAVAKPGPVLVGEGEASGKDIHLDRFATATFGPDGKGPVIDLAAGADASHHTITIEGASTGAATVSSEIAVGRTFDAELSHDETSPYVADTPPAALLDHATVQIVASEHGRDRDRFVYGSGPTLRLPPEIASVTVTHRHASFARLAGTWSYLLELSQYPDGNRLAWTYDVARVPDGHRITFELPTIDLPGWRRFALRRGRVHWRLTAMSSDGLSESVRSGQIPP